ncbi:TetR family transcriptional regulator C-terminal domain-containing protein [Streptomyces sp. NPDC048111]|uniref:TetR family transcriptional regulator C-terminal domain-containing protein n=1 Tax=Streptomyces sp. NPDC048111 TaxID=3365500 RepID=UPI0037185A42
MNERTGQRSSRGAAADAGAARPAAAVEDVTDQRLLRGLRTRRRIARRGVDIASLEGLSGLSIGRLASDLELSKSGIQTLFTTKEKVQLAVAESAREAFAEAVVLPARAAGPGAARLRALTDLWTAYAEAPLFPGGCFWAAALPDFDSRPGAVRDALLAHRSGWLALLAGELRYAAEAHEIAALDPEFTAFQIDAVLTATNTALRLGEAGAVDRARRVIDGFLTPVRAGRPRS